MPSRAIVFTIFCLNVLIGLTACSSLRSDLLQRYVQDPTLNVKQIALTRIDHHKVHLGLLMEVDNPNAHAISLTGFDYSVKFNKRLVFAGNNLQATRLPARGSQLIHMPIILEFAEARRLLQELDRDGHLNFEIKADIDVDAAATHAITISTTTRGSFVLPHLPQIGLADIDVTDWGLRDAKMRVILKISNPNDFEIDISEIKYSLDIAGHRWLQGTLQAPVKLVPQQNTLATIDAEFHLNELGDSVLELIRTRDLNSIELDASLVLDNPFPSLQNLEVPIQFQAN